MSENTGQYICKHPKGTKRLLGINFEQLEQLIELAKTLHQKQQEENEIKSPRLICSGGGRASILSVEEQVILTLMYLIHNLTFQVLGIMFNISESSAHKLFNHWQELFREGLPASFFSWCACPRRGKESRGRTARTSKKVGR